MIGQKKSIYSERNALFESQRKAERKGYSSPETMEKALAFKSKQEKRSRKLERRKVRREAKQAGIFFKEAFKQANEQAKQGSKIVKGILKSTRVGQGRGIQRVQRLPQVNVSNWSDMGLIAGSPFKLYQSRNVFPSSRPDRLLHPQEKAEIDSIIHKQRLFGTSQTIEELLRKKKESESI